MHRRNKDGTYTRRIKVISSSTRISTITFTLYFHLLKALNIKKVINHESSVELQNGEMQCQSGDTQ